MVAKMEKTTIPTLLFSDKFGAREEYEAEARGYLSHVFVKLPSGAKVSVVFYDIVRLQQDLEEEAKLGRPFIADPGMILLENVTIPNMQAAVSKLFLEGFFDSFSDN